MNAISSQRHCWRRLCTVVVALAIAAPAFAAQQNVAGGRTMSMTPLGMDRTHRFSPFNLLRAIFVLLLWIALTGVAHAQSVSTDENAYAPNEDFQGIYSDGPGNLTDRLDVFPQGEIPSALPSLHASAFVNSNGGNTFSNGAITFTEDLAEGCWVVWFMDGATVLGSKEFSVDTELGDRCVGGGSALRVGPYLQNATDSTMVVMWETVGYGESTVEYGPTQALGLSKTGSSIASNLPAGTSRIHTVSLTGLNQGQAYYYRLPNNGAPVPQQGSFKFRTLSDDPETTSTLVVYSDMQEQGAAPTSIHGRHIRESMLNIDGPFGFLNEWTGVTSENIADGIDFVVVPGDLVDVGSKYTDWEEEFFDEAQPLIQHVPYFTVLGNHEGNHQNYYDFMHNPDNGSGGADAERWYTVQHGNVLLVSLDTNIDSPVQLAWLDDKLNEACFDPNVDFVFAQFHHAHISETWTAGQANSAADIVNRLIDFSDPTVGCTAGKASIHFQGHNHSYQRGQVRDHHHFYMDVSGAEGDLAWWGEYGQANSPIIQTARVSFGWNFVEVMAGNDPSFRVRRVSTYDETLPNRSYAAMTFPGTVVDDITFAKNSAAPNAPMTLNPAVGGTVSENDVVLQASAFEGVQSGAFHLASHFQITTTPGDYSAPAVDQWFRFEDRYMKVNLNEGIDLTRSTDTINLSGQTNYYWRVRYRDSGFKWSAWSEEATFNTNAPSTDTDGDGINDDIDNCVNTPNADQLDDDSDGVGNVCDNCQIVANADQCDTNGDGFGNVCDGDLNNNGVINFVDLGIFKAAFLSSPAGANWNEDADLSCDGVVVNFVDLGLMKSRWLLPPGPSGIAP